MPVVPNAIFCVGLAIVQSDAVVLQKAGALVV
jgi:hypothetical protein